MDRILPLGRGATVRQGPQDRLNTGSKPSAAAGDSHRQARPSNLDSICRGQQMSFQSVRLKAFFVNYLPCQGCRSAG